MASILASVVAKEDLCHCTADADASAAAGVSSSQQDLACCVLMLMSATHADDREVRSLMATPQAMVHEQLFKLHFVI